MSKISNQETKEIQCRMLAAEAKLAEVKEQTTIIRRAAENGLAFAQKEDTTCVDTFQHVVDEARRLESLLT